MVVAKTENWVSFAASIVHDRLIAAKKRDCMSIDAVLESYGRMCINSLISMMHLSSTIKKRPSRERFKLKQCCSILELILLSEIEIDVAV